MTRKKIIYLLSILLMAHSVKAADTPSSPTPAPRESFYGAQAAVQEVSIVDPDEKPAEAKPAASQRLREVSIDETAADVSPVQAKPSSSPRLPKPVPVTKTADRKKEKEPIEAKKQQDDILDIPSTSLDDDAGGQLAIPEVTQKALLSNHDPNRIVCREPIKDIFYGKDTPVEVDYTGNNAIVTFLMKKIGENTEYIRKPVALYIMCGEEAYNLIAVPRDVPSQTIRLDSGKKSKARENASMFKEQHSKKVAAALIKRAYQDDLPDSFTLARVGKSLNVFRDLSVVHVRTVTVDGEGYILKEYRITSHVDGVELNERDFIRKEFTERPFAMGVYPPKPAKGESARLFIVETKAAISGEALNVQ